MEDEGTSGSSGSHFETIMFRDELMTSYMDKLITMTKISMAVLEDSGWY